MRSFRSESGHVLFDVTAGAYTPRITASNASATDSPFMHAKCTAVETDAGVTHAFGSLTNASIFFHDPATGTSRVTTRSFVSTSTYANRRDGAPIPRRNSAAHAPWSLSRHRDSISGTPSAASFALHQSTQKASTGGGGGGAPASAGEPLRLAMTVASARPRASSSSPRFR